jgi:hypothetical protein
VEPVFLWEKWPALRRPTDSNQIPWEKRWTKNGSRFSARRRPALLGVKATNEKGGASSGSTFDWFEQPLETRLTQHCGAAVHHDGLPSNVVEIGTHQRQHHRRYIVLGVPVAA